MAPTDSLERVASWSPAVRAVSRDQLAASERRASETCWDSSGPDVLMRVWRKRLDSVIVNWRGTGNVACSLSVEETARIVVMS